MLRRRAPLLAAGAAAALLGVCGCGSTTTVGSSRTLQIGLDEYRVLPQDVRTTAGPLTIVVHNYGRLTHSLVITLHGLPEASTGPIAPGETTDLYATLEAGDYVMASSILSDQALGAYGTLDVGS